MSGINGIHGSNVAQTSQLGRLVQTADGQIGFVPVSLDSQDQNDIASKSAPKKSFSYFRAGVRFLQGAVLDTIDNLFSVKGLVGIGISAAAVGVFGAPALIGLGALGAAFGAAHMIGNIRKSNELYAEGKVRESENVYRGVGVGFSSLALSVAGLRTSVKNYLQGPAKVAEVTAGAKQAGNKVLNSVGQFFKSFVGPDGKTIQIPSFKAKDIANVAFTKAAQNTGKLLQNGNVANGVAITALHAEGEAVRLKDKMDCIQL